MVSGQGNILLILVGNSAQVKTGILPPLHPPPPHHKEFNVYQRLFFAVLKVGKKREKEKRKTLYQLLHLYGKGAALSTMGREKPLEVSQFKQ